MPGETVTSAESATIQIATPDTQEMTLGGLRVLTAAQDLAVTNEPEMQKASDYIGDIKKAEKAVGLLMDEPCKLANDLHKSLTARRGALLAPLAEARATVNKKVGAFMEAEDARVREEQRKRDEAIAKQKAEADRVERERVAAKEKADREQREKEEAAVKKAAELRKAGEDKKAAELLEKAAEEAPPPPPPTAPLTVIDTPPPPRAAAQASGISRAKRWKAELTDIRLLAAAVASGEVPEDYISADLKVMSPIAKKKQQRDIGIPGVIGVPDVSIRSRG